METRHVEMSARERENRAGEIRSTSEDDWIDAFASGSLQKAKRLGFSYRGLYLAERCAHDFGWTFQVLPRTRVTLGDALMEGDSRPLTETCWFASRLIARNVFPDSDCYELKYIQTFETDVNALSTEEGVGVVLSRSSASWIPAGHVVFAIIAEWKNGAWRDAKNPC